MIEESFQAATNAGKMTTELAKTIPNSGGLISLFTGDNKMDTFGSQLVLFGESIASFSEKVDGKVSEESVQAAANAGAAMVKLADTIPNTGGLISLFSGDNRIDKFGTQLVSFGESFASYSEKMSSVNSDVVNTTTSAAESLVKLSEAIVSADGGWLSDYLYDFCKYVSSFGV